ncbi:MAG: hypothetical protein JNL28_01560 [Planctomycetes bacterium]|nr:hypothetical protein [Planctomycetota bacterium]
MKIVQTTLLASSFLFVTYVVAPTRAVAGGWQCQAQWENAQQVGEQVDTSLSAAIAKSRKGLTCIDEVSALDVAVAGENDLFAGLMDPCLIEEVLDQELQDLHARTVNYVAQEADFLKTQYEIALARYERLVLQIQEDWAKGLIADDIAEQALYTLRVEAFEYLRQLGLDTIREDLEQAILELVDRGKDATQQNEAMQEFYEKVYTARLTASLAILQERVTAGKASKTDFWMVAEIVAALEHIKNFGTPYRCAQ